MPYLGYFQLMKLVDEYVIYDDVQYIKNGWINRNMILINGEKKYLTMQLSTTSPNKLINDISVNDNFVKISKTLKIVYSNAPYFEDSYKLLLSIFEYENNNLARFIGNSFQKIFEYLNIEKNLIYSSEIDKNNGLKAQSKVIEICKKLNADVYINAIGGADLYSSRDFSDNGISLKYIKTNFEEYKQFRTPFIPGLSIIDILMFNSPQEINRMLDNYELI